MNGLAGTNILGARIHSGLASNFLGIPASELLDQSLPLCDIWGDSKTSEFSRIADQSTLQARMSAMEVLLIRRGACQSRGQRKICEVPCKGQFTN